MARPTGLRLIDVHCHVNFAAYRKDPDGPIRRALERGIGMIAVGTQADTSREAVRAAARHEGVWAIVGLHPVHLFPDRISEEESSFSGRAERFDPEAYRQMVRESGGRVVGLGECGLDYFHRPAGVSVEEAVRVQAECLEAHLDLAEELGLPVMVHCRDAAPEEMAAFREGNPTGPWSPGHSAHNDVLAILRRRAASGRRDRGNVHCFAGTWEQAQGYLDLGFFISFTGIVTYPERKRDREAGIVSPAELARRMPLDRLLAETDSPYLSPVPFRGQWPNEPANVEFVAAELARLHGLMPADMERILLRNAERLFGL